MVPLVVTLYNYVLVLIANPITDSYEQSYIASRAASYAKTWSLRYYPPPVTVSRYHDVLFPIDSYRGKSESHGVQYNLGCLTQFYQL